jgi:thiol peroxidase
MNFSTLNKDHQNLADNFLRFAKNLNNMPLNSTAFKGHPIDLIDDLPEVNENAFDFTFVKTDLSESSLYDFDNKIKVLIGLPSLDTGVCQKEARQFNEKLNAKEGVVGIVISKDLPFAMKRFCEAEGLSNIVPASDFRYNDFSSEYNTEMTNGPLKGLIARTVFVVDKNNKIRHVEITPDITVEPDYDKILNVVDSL